MSDIQGKIQEIDKQIDNWQKLGAEDIEKAYKIIKSGEYIHEDFWDEIGEKAKEISMLCSRRYFLAN